MDRLELDLVKLPYISVSAGGRIRIQDETNVKLILRLLQAYSLFYLMLVKCLHKSANLMLDYILFSRNKECIVVKHSENS